MSILIDSILLLFLFFVLGFGADLAVKNIKYIATILKIKLFAFGILLGLITTLPELSVGINATIDKASALSVGNMLSGIIVMFGLILGISLILNRQIATDGRWSVLIPQVIVILSPILFGLDGGYGMFDGLAMILLYLGLIYYLYLANHVSSLSFPEIINKNKVAKSFFLSICGIAVVLISSHWIVDITLDLLKHVNISKLAIGALVFAIGTNLPEITIAFTSWRKKSSELSLSHLISSAFTNVLVLGVLAVIQPINFTIGPAFWILIVFLCLTVFSFLFFYHSGKKMDRREGYALLLIYILFLAVNFWFLRT